MTHEDFALIHKILKAQCECTKSQALLKNINSKIRNLNFGSGNMNLMVQLATRPRVVSAKEDFCSAQRKLYGECNATLKQMRSRRGNDEINLSLP
jgi:hypothetical protein